MGPRKGQIKKRKMEPAEVAVEEVEDYDSDSSINSSSSETWSELGDRLLGLGNSSTNTHTNDDDNDDDGLPSESEVEMDMTPLPLDIKSIKTEPGDPAAAAATTGHFIGNNYDDFMNKLFNSDDGENGESSKTVSRGRGRPKKKGSKPTSSSTDFVQSKRTGKQAKKKEIKNKEHVTVLTRSGRQSTQKNYSDSDDSNPCLPGILKANARNRRVFAKRVKISRERYISYSNCLYSCNICERSYYTKEHLQEHYQKHLENLICIGLNLGCQHRSKSSKDLAQHIRICQFATQAKEKVLENVQSKPFLCIFPDCERTLIDSKGVTEHLRRFHEAKQILIETGGTSYSDFAFICSVCNRKYFTDAHLQTHYQKHLDLKCIGINLGCTYVSVEIEELKDHLISCPWSIKVKESTIENARVKPYLCLFPECDRSFISSKGSMKHIKLFHDLKQQPANEVSYSECLFNCKICDRNYFSDDLLQTHYEKHLDLNCTGANLGCTFVSIKNKKELKEHLSNCPHAIQVKESTMANAQIKPFLCLIPDCDRSFISSEGAVKHIKLFHDLKQQPVKEVSYSDCSYNCTICGRNYYTDDHLQLHYQKHMDNLNCIGINLGCLQVTENAEQLKYHLKSCTFSIQIMETTALNAKVKPFLCLFPECERSFIDAAGVTRHLRLFHESKNQQQLTYSSCFYTCDICERKFFSQDHLQRHYDKHLENLCCIGGSFGCNQICSSVEELKEHLYSCPKSIQLKEKILKNTTIKPYLCLYPQCERAFVSLKDGVNRHMRIYHDNKEISILSEADSIPYLCHICGKGFVKEKSRENHVLLIHNESSELCHLCGISIKIRNMKSHMTLKHESHEFPCTFEGCGKSFKRRYRLKEHALTHTDNPGFLCIHCGRQYISLKSYNDHMKLHLEGCDVVAKNQFTEFVKNENAGKSPDEIDRIVELAWYYSPNVLEESLHQQNETPVEKAIRMRYETIAMIFRRGLKSPNETIEDCYREFKKVRTEKTLRGLIKRREFETDEEKAARRAKYRRVAQKFRENNPEKVKAYIKNYNKRKIERLPVDKNSPKYIFYVEKMKEKQRERWSNMSSEKKEQRLEKMKMYQKVRQQRKELEKYF